MNTQMFIIEARLFDRTDYAIAGVCDTLEGARETAITLVENLRRITHLPFPESVPNRWQDSQNPLYAAITITQHTLNSPHIGGFISMWESKGHRT
jgi:hypothetical protein